MFISKTLVELIERNADSLTREWLADVQKHPDTPTYHNFAPDELYKRCFKVYSQLETWLSSETSKEDIAANYTELGKTRQSEGFALSEVIQALILIRRRLWLKILSEGFLDSAMEYRRALELNNRVILFFDRAIFYTALGYEKS
jgi:hypothetical protein